MKPVKKACEMTRAELAAYIDQSVLKPEFTQEDIKKYIQEGIDFGCKTVCINPSSLDMARALCRGTNTGICAVCDFPFGLSSTASRIAQIEDICAGGAIDDLDIVANYGLIKSGLWDKVEEDFQKVTQAVHRFNAVIKIIFETDALSLADIAKATDIACKAGADFVKTSTGFYTGAQNKGAVPEVVRCMIEESRGRCKVKGSGGIRTQEHFFELIDMGIDRMGIGYKSTPVVLQNAP